MRSNIYWNPTHIKICWCFRETNCFFKKLTTSFKKLTCFFIMKLRTSFTKLSCLRNMKVTASFTKKICSNFMKLRTSKVCFVCLWKHNKTKKHKVSLFLGVRDVITDILRCRCFRWRSSLFTTWTNHPHGNLQNTPHS